MREREAAPQEPLRDELEYETVAARDLAQDELELLFLALEGALARQMPEGSARARVMALLGEAYVWAARYL